MRVPSLTIAAVTAVLLSSTGCGDAREPNSADAPPTEVIDVDGATSDFVAAARSTYGNVDARVFETAEQVVGASELIVLAEVTGAEPGRDIHLEETNELIHTTVWIEVKVTEVLGGSVVKAGDSLVVELLSPEGKSADLAKALGNEGQELLLGLDDITSLDNFVTPDGARLEGKGGTAWAPLPQLFIARGGDGRAYLSGSPEGRSVVADESGRTLSFDEATALARELVGRVPLNAHDASAG